MDWQSTSPEAFKTVDLAVIKVEATVPITDVTYGGAVVLNPGATTQCFETELIGLAQTLKYLQEALVALAWAKCSAEATQSERFCLPDQIPETRPQEYRLPYSTSEPIHLLLPK
jgi:hypothetical protein